jgi:hypothetical protein
MSVTTLTVQFLCGATYNARPEPNLCDRPPVVDITEHGGFDPTFRRWVQVHARVRRGKSWAAEGGLSSMRSGFEVRAAYAMGVMLPALEAARRRTNFDDIPAYIDDFITGALLLWAARSVSRGHAYGPALLIAAWGILCGGLWGSFFTQVMSVKPNDVSGLKNGVVVLIKGALYLVALAALYLSVRRAARAERRSL